MQIRQFRVLRWVALSQWFDFDGSTHVTVEIVATLLDCYTKVIGI